MSELIQEGQHKGEFLLSRGHGNISFDQGVLSSGNNVPDGRLLKWSGGELVPTTGALNSAGDSDEDIAGFAYGATDATSADAPIVIVSRLAEFKLSAVTLHNVTGGGAAAATAAVIKALAAKNLIGR